MLKYVPRQDKLKTQLVKTAGVLFRTSKSPDEGLGELFEAVQQNRIYQDGKTFTDLIPRGRMKEIQREYLLSKQDPNFDLQEFVNRHFYEFAPHASREEYHTNNEHTVSEHINELWGVLERRNRLTRGSLLALPYPYIVPGGRFGEQFYWDSYFIMLGLEADGRIDMIEGMVKNSAFMIRKFGYIPTANRSYFLSRSQPPMFTGMVRLLARHNGKLRTFSEYLPYLLSEYRFWMKGRTKLHKREHKAYARVVEMPNGMNLNRYYDNKKTPRPESLREDVSTAKEAKNREADRLYLHLRAGAESGWDFSSRWMHQPNDISTIHTADIIPVDLNCLLFQLEETISETYRLLKNPLLARKFHALAERRKRAIQTYCWSEDEAFFVDYNFHHQEPTGVLSLAAVFPLYMRIATKKQADAVAERLKKDFLKPGGLVTTLNHTGQQWDAPNGWAPLQWIAVHGLRNYGHHSLANEIKRRWVNLNTKVYMRDHKLLEKYNVEDKTGIGSGGEYPLQDGFGWTNGVLRAFLAEDH